MGLANHSRRVATPNNARPRRCGASRPSTRQVFRKRSHPRTGEVFPRERPQTTATLLPDEPIATASLRRRAPLTRQVSFLAVHADVLAGGLDAGAVHAQGRVRRAAARTGGPVYRIPHRPLQQVVVLQGRPRPQRRREVVSGGGVQSPNDAGRGSVGKAQENEREPFADFQELPTKSSQGFAGSAQRQRERSSTRWRPGSGWGRLGVEPTERR